MTSDDGGTAASWLANGESAALFNATLAGAAVAALDELGLLDELRAESQVSIAAFATRASLDEAALRTLVRALVTADVVVLDGDDDSVRPGPAFEPVFRDKGYFLWLVRGYGDMLQRLADLARTEASGSEYQRDGRYIALAGRDYGGQFVDADFRRVLGAQSFEVACDIGCGSGGRLIALANENPHTRAIGIGIDDRGVEVARQAVAASGLAHRITIEHCDVCEVEPRPAFAGVDVLFAFFNGHDLWPRERCIETLDRIHRSFPRAERFLLCDTYRSALGPEQPVPSFTLGFEMTHAVMRQYVPTRDEWLEVFAESKWSCVGEHPIGIPYSAIFDLRR